MVLGPAGGAGGASMQVRRACSTVVQLRPVWPAEAQQAVWSLLVSLIPRGGLDWGGGERAHRAQRT